jgi:hypothetical protein
VQFPYEARVEMMRRSCNGYWPDTVPTPEWMMQVYLRRCLDQARKLSDNPTRDGEELWVVRDALGLEFWPWISVPLTWSMDKVTHAPEMKTGYDLQGEFHTDQNSFDLTICSI